MISFATVTAEQCTGKCLLWMEQHEFKSDVGSSLNKRMGEDE